MRNTGEGEVSRGLMVPVFEARNAGRIAQALAVLDAAHIPALDAAEAVGLLMAPLAPGTFVVVVPSTFLESAQRALEQSGLLPVGLVALASDGRTDRDPPGFPGRKERGPGALPVINPTEGTMLGPHAVPTALTTPGLRGRSASTLTVRPTTAVDLEPIEAPPFEASSPQTRFTVALAGCAIGALLQASFLMQVGEKELRRLLALSYDGTAFHGNIVTAGFIHGSTVHFLGNLGFGLLLGYVLVGTHGLGAAAAVWILASMLGIAAEAMLSPGAIVLGASAGLYGLIGLWLRGELQRARRAALPRRAIFRALGVIVLLAPGALTPVTSSGGRVAVLAHLVGFSVGLLAGSLFPRWLGAGDLERGGGKNRVAFGFASLITAAGLLAAFLAV
ncbi:MAG: rhomboid family intramembrane serine protease [Myxococcota bacterium]